MSSTKSRIGALEASLQDVMSKLQRLDATASAHLSELERRTQEQQKWIGDVASDLERIRADRHLQYSLVADLCERHARSPFNDLDQEDLTPYELSLFSQNGEDGVLAEIYRRIGVTNRQFVEFGIESGVEGNAVALAQVLGWHGLFIEASAGHFDELQRRYRGIPGVRTLNSVVTPENVDALLLENGVPAEPDLVSIDVDSIDYWIWRAMERIRSRVVVIEYNSRLDPDARITVPFDHREGWDGTDVFGASLGALESLAQTKGYRLVHTDLAGVNAFFVREDVGRAFDDLTRVPRRSANYDLRGARHPEFQGTASWVEV